MEQVKIKYVGHACFKLSYSGAEIVLDPYADGKVPGLAAVQEDADFVYCSHQHDDHGCVEAVAQRSYAGEPPFTVEELQTPHDDCDGAKRGMNLIRVFTFGNMKVAHLGDLGRELTEDEAAILSGLDCMMIPVGGFYTIDADTAKSVVAQTAPKVVIPMHYRSERFGFDVIGPVDGFLAGFENVNHCGSELVLTKDTPAQVCVMKPARMD